MPPSSGLGGGFLVSSHPCGLRHGWAWLVLWVLYGRMPFRLWAFVTAFRSKIPEASLSGLQTSSGPLVLLLPLGLLGESQELLCKRLESLRLPQDMLLCIYHPYFQVLIDRAPCQNRGFSERLSDPLGDYASSTTVF